MSHQEESTLAVGSGPILLALAESWYEAGLSKLTVFISDMDATDTAKLMQLREGALGANPEASLKILTAAGDEEPDWRSIIEPFQFIIYVAETGEWRELHQLQDACIAERRLLLPAIALQGLGLAGPLVDPGACERWESAWRRIHVSALPKNREHEYLSTAAAAVLANIVVHQWHKVISQNEALDCRNQCFVLEPEKLTGSWHRVLPHPLVSGYEAAQQLLTPELSRSLEIRDVSLNPEEWSKYFKGLTSEVTGIFHTWGEGDLIQLPLAQCLVQPVDLLTEGPAQLLPAIVCSGLTHEEARRESALAGLEAYAARMLPLQFAGLPLHLQEGVFIGAGSTVAEAVGRALRFSLAQKLAGRLHSQRQHVTSITWMEVEDIRCRFYLDALNITEGEVLIAAGEPLLGFSVVWVCSGSLWYVSADLSFTLALRSSLMKALNKAEPLEITPVIEEAQEIEAAVISDGEPVDYSSLTQEALKTLMQFSASMKVFDLRSESLLGAGPFAIYGVILKEEEEVP
ncbi:putative thiazole-containing bacteriocin maturation protein [Paenibacillus sp. YSY-4.3]